MITNMFTKAIALLTLLTAPVTLTAQTLEFTYADGEESYMGTSKKERYDVAIHISDKGMEGAHITNLSVPLTSADISDVTVWFSSGLNLTLVDNKKINAPDIMETSVGVADGMINIDFIEPVEIPEGGLYAGYSFSVDELSDSTWRPVSVTLNTNPEGLFVHTTKTYRNWVEASSLLNACSQIKLQIEGDFSRSNAAGIKEIDRIRVVRDTPFSINAEIVNHGSNSISSFDYEYSLDYGNGFSGHGSYSFPTPISSEFGASAIAQLPIDPLPIAGTFDINLTITGVNGQPNEDSHPSAVARAKILSFRPAHRTVMEEYTALWCGYCVRGIAAIEKLSGKYPDNFIALAYHSNDAMAFTSDFPSPVSGFPEAYINRTISADPYFGHELTGYDFGIEPLIAGSIDELAPAAIEVSAKWEDDNNVNVESSIIFAEIPDNEYRVAYVLIENDMHNPTWIQINKYGNNAEGPASLYIPEMARFCEAGEAVPGIHFNDVVVAASDYSGVANSITDPEMDTEIVHNYTFNDISDIKNINGQPLVSDKGNLRAVALLIDSATGHIVNAAESGQISSPDAVDEISGRSEILRIEYYDLSGRRLKHVANGLYLRKTIFRNGTSETNLIMAK